jgi:ATP-dependent Clp protease ATP-binding subunit ClpA
VLLPLAEATPDVHQVIRRACEEAVRRRHRTVVAEHVLSALLTVPDGAACHIIDYLGVDRTELERELNEVLTLQPTIEPGTSTAPDMDELRALYESAHDQYSHCWPGTYLISTAALFNALGHRVFYSLRDLLRGNGASFESSTVAVADDPVDFSFLLDFLRTERPVLENANLVRITDGALEEALRQTNDTPHARRLGRARELLLAAGRARRSAESYKDLRDIEHAFWRLRAQTEAAVNELDFERAALRHRQATRLREVRRERVRSCMDQTDRVLDAAGVAAHRSAMAP